LRDAIEKEQVLIYNWLFETAVERRPLASDFHARLTDTLATGTVDEAEAAMRQHIRFGLSEILARLPALAEAKAGWRPQRRVK
jgi:DNA-binding GntR family transcriptional regulator